MNNKLNYFVLNCQTFIKLSKLQNIRNILLEEYIKIKKMQIESLSIITIFKFPNSPNQINYFSAVFVIRKLSLKDCLFKKILILLFYMYSVL